ncbi:hypothetical protein AYI69_g1919, partial [Smittium culicis]
MDGVISTAQIRDITRLERT